MDGEGDIVVIGSPEETTTGSYAPTAIVTGSGPGGDGPNRQIRENQAAANASVVVEPDASDDEIVVIARSMRSTNTGINMQMTPSRVINLPCIGPKGSSEIRGLALGIKFNVTTRSFGVGRAGENLAKSGGNIVIDINNVALKGYYKLNGGLLYLTLQEIAHSFKEMRDFNKAQFEAYSRAGGAGKSLAERKADFPNSPEFKENERRANSIARALANAMNNANFNFVPTEGYTTSC